MKRTSKIGGSAAKRRKKAKVAARRDKDSDSEPEEEAKTASVNASVERDLEEARLQAAEPKVLDDGAADEEPGESAVDTDAKPDDPYLMADADYIKKDTRWRNKQRTLVFCSRGVTSRFRHLTEDIKRMVPHHKAEPKFDKSQKLHEINEVCELKSCNNVLFFESRKKQDLYMYLARVPSGPTIKFQVLNLHTTGEVRLAGNCLHGSRPLLQFDDNFQHISFLRLIKEMLVQAVGTPRNHPKSKPFHDHIMSFYYLDKKIWFRHYQVTPETEADRDDPERQALTEIGPRFVLDPIRILSGSFSGQTLYANAFYMSPTALRSQAKRLLKNPYRRKLETRQERQNRIKDNEAPPDPLEGAFI